MNSIMLTKIWRDKYIHEHHAYEKNKNKNKNKNAGYVNVGSFQQ